MQKLEKETVIISVKIFKEDLELIKNKVKDDGKNIKTSTFIRNIIHMACENTRQKKMEPKAPFGEN